METIMEPMSVKRRNLTLVLVSLMVGAIYFVPFIRYFFYDQVIIGFKLTNAQLGYLASVYGVVALFCYPIGGILSDRFSARSLLGIAFIAMAGLTFWQATFPAYGVLIVIYVFYAIFTTATLWPPYIKLVRSLGVEKDQGKLFGTSEAIRGVISSLIGFSFLWLLSRFSDGVSGLRMVLIICAIFYLIFAVLAFVLLPKNTNNQPEKIKEDKGTGLSNFIEAIKLPGTWLLSIFIFSCYCVITAGVNYLGTYTTQILGVSALTSSGLAIFRSYVIVIVAGILGGIYADKSKSRSLFISYLLLAIIVCVTVMLFSEKFVIFTIVISILLSFSYFMIKSLYFSVQGESGIPLRLSGSAIGIVSFIAYTPDAFMTALMGPWLDSNAARGFHLIFAWMIFWSVIGIIMGVIISKCNKKLVQNNMEVE